MAHRLINTSILYNLFIDDQDTLLSMFCQNKGLSLHSLKQSKANKFYKGLNLVFGPLLHDKENVGVQLNIVFSNIYNRSSRWCINK